MTTTNLSINTGAPRNVVGHVVSGSLAAGAVAVALNYDKYKKGEIEKREAINDSIKLTAQGGIATGSAIAAANYLGKGSILNMFTAISVGIAGVYAVEKVNEMLLQNKNIETQEEL